jgi:hypothetical protein
MKRHGIIDTIDIVDRQWLGLLPVVAYLLMMAG